MARGRGSWEAHDFPYFPKNIGHFSVIWTFEERETSGRNIGRPGSITTDMLRKEKQVDNILNLCWQEMLGHTATEGEITA